MKTKKSFTFNKLYLFAFLIPAVIMLVIFAIREIYPFGDRSFLHIDMYHQYFPFLVEFYHKLKNGESLFYSWNTGIGSNFLALYVYYLASPTNWLAIFCPEGHLMEFITYMVVIKTGLCGTTFAVYLKKHFHTDTWAILFFSTFYALSGYMAAYSWNVMWLDCIVLAPIIILLGIYVVLNGHLSPGGGFSGGAIMGAGLMIYVTAFGFKDIRRFFTYKTYQRVVLCSLLTYAASKCYSFYTGANDIHSIIPLGTPGAILSSGLILVLNICVGLIVTCTMYAFYAVFRKGEV